MQKRLCQSEKPIKQQQPQLCSRGCCCHIVFLFHARHFRECGDALRKLGVGGDVVRHLAVVELLVGHHVEVAGAGETEDDGLFLAGLLALEGLVDGGADGVAALGGGQDALSLVWVDSITSLS